jgi:hypothetical protein
MACPPARSRLASAARAGPPGPGPACRVQLQPQFARRAHPGVINVSCPGQGPPSTGTPHCRRLCHRNAAVGGPGDFPPCKMATEGDLGQVDLSSLVDLMIAGEADEREAGAFAVAEFVAESDSHQVVLPMQKS